MSYNIDSKEDYKAPPPYKQFNEPYDHRKPPPMHNQHYDQQQRMRLDDPRTLSEEEKQLLYGCRKDSFWQRSLPLSIGCFIGLRMAQQKGFVKWSVWKDFGALFGGYVIGKASFIPVCKRRIVERLPNSNLARAVTGEKLLSNDPNTYGSAGSSTVLCLRHKMVKKYIQTLTWIQILDLTDQPLQETQQPVKKSVTYDDLRQMSRQKVTPLPRQDMYSSRLPVYPDNHDNDRQNNDNDSGFSQRDDSFNKQPQQDEESRNRRRRPQFSPDSGAKNQYGDVWDKV
ncbi:unnamed protein product [Mytilus edulis]|uniref:OCIA domain-containing protein n=1 Tax=Mytilus edulis TaxID=6550 RepID=A0A8S3RI93_MYTED|nr:unnamed protein product [Mytilus edulis]